MVDINEVKQFVDFISNKVQSGSVSPNEFNLAARRANISLFKRRYGLPEEYQPGRPIPSQGYEVTQKIKDDLRVFKTTVTIMVDSAGKMILPNDYVHKLAINFRKVVNNATGNPTVTFSEVETVDDDKFTGRKRSSLKAPTNDYPICNFNNTFVEFAPADLGEVEFIYLRLPADPVWGFNIVNTIELYDAAQSTNFEWNEIVTDDLSAIILDYIGINIREIPLDEWAKLYKQQGQ